MSCSHNNPDGSVFCRICGEILPHLRCRCGQACAVGDNYCFRCGIPLKGERQLEGGSSLPVSQRYDLEELAALAREENIFLESQKARVTQDDIRKMVAKRRKKFS